MKTTLINILGLRNYLRIKRRFFTKNHANRSYLLAEFPKAGGTYVSLIIMNLLNLNTSSPQITWFNLHNHIDDLDLKGYGGHLLGKTHKLNYLGYKNIFLLYRPVKDQLLSWYIYNCEYFDYKKNFNDFLSSDKGISYYESFYRSYIDYALPWQKIYLIRLDRIADIDAEVEALAQVLGVETCPNKIKQLRDRTTRKYLEKSESITNVGRVNFVAAKKQIENNNYWVDVPEEYVNRIENIEKRLNDLLPLRTA